MSGEMKENDAMSEPKSMGDYLALPEAEKLRLTGIAPPPPTLAPKFYRRRIEVKP